MPTDTEASKPSSAKPRLAARKGQSIDLEARAAAPAKKAAVNAVAEAKKPAPSGAKVRPRRSTAVPPIAAPQVRGAPPFDHDVRRALIAQTAYFRAERRGFAAGGEERDWLEAEAEVDALLGDGRPRAANDG
jgi:Protein of unknown function (DUF2934)